MVVGFPKSQNIGKMYDKKMGNDREKIGETRIGKTSLGDGSGWDTSQNMKDLKASGKVDITKGNSMWEGWGSALKPSYEPIIIARKPFKGSLVDNVIEWGVGGINIDECRIDLEDTYEYKETNRQARTENTVFDNNHSGFRSENNNTAVASPKGRFPANTILTYDQMTFDEVCGGFPDTKGNGNIRKNKNNGKNYNCYSNYGDCETKGYEDSGSAARYFYNAKASKKDRDEGLEEFEDGNITDGRKAISDRPYLRKETLRKNTHPTVKPTNLMQYLVRLVTPKNGIVLDPFMGSGSTGKAVMYENKERNADYKFIGIEITDEYLPIANARIRYVNKNI